MPGFLKRLTGTKPLLVALTGGKWVQAKSALKRIDAQEIDLAGDGRRLVVELLATSTGAERTVPFTQLYLRVREPGEAETARVLAKAKITGTKADLHLVDFAGDGRPVITVMGMWKAIAGTVDFVECFRWQGERLQRVGRFVAEYGSIRLLKDRKQMAIFLVSLRVVDHQSISFQFWPDMLSKHSPRLRRIQVVGWSSNKMRIISEESSRLAYMPGTNHVVERPLPRDAFILYGAGEVFLLHGLAEKAIEPLMYALHLVPEYPDALSALARAHAMLQQWPQSLDAAARAVQLNPWHTEAQLHLGIARLRLGHATEATRALQMAIALHDERWEAHYWLGIAWERQGCKEQAIVHYLRALQLNPVATEAQKALVSD